MVFRQSGIYRSVCVDLILLGGCVVVRLPGQGVVVRQSRKCSTICVVVKQSGRCSSVCDDLILPRGSIVRLRLLGQGVVVRLPVGDVVPIPSGGGSTGFSWSVDRVTSRFSDTCILHMVARGTLLSLLLSSSSPLFIQISIIRHVSPPRSCGILQ